MSDDLVARISLCLGLRFRAMDLPALGGYLANRQRVLALDRVDDYLIVLGSNSAAGRQERELFVARFTTGESYFLRDHRQLGVIIGQLVPELMERHAATRRLRFWSAGCSTGEEPYTLAMLLFEEIPELADWDIEIIASDINSRVLDIARRGVYTEWSFRGMDNDRRQRYFHTRRGGCEWVIDRALQKHVRFAQLDLVATQLPDPGHGLIDIDLILCRNVLIYMTPTAVSAVASKLSSTLAEGGYLVTGHGELLGHNTHGLRTRVFADSVVLHKEAQNPQTPACAPSDRRVTATADVSVSLPRTTMPPALCLPTRVASAAAVSARTFEGLMQQAWREADRGLTDNARDSCHQAMAIAPFDPWPYYLMAQLEQMSGDTEQARLLLGKAIYLEPQLIAAYLELAMLSAEVAPVRARAMLQAASRELRKMPPENPIRPYSNSNAADLLAYIERQLNNPAIVAIDRDARQAAVA